MWLKTAATLLWSADFSPHGRCATVEVKGVDIHPETGRIALVRADPGGWWLDKVWFFHPEGKWQQDGQRLYKARWMLHGTD